MSIWRDSWGGQKCVCFFLCWQTGSSHGLRTSQGSVKRRVRDVPLPHPVCVLDWLFLHLQGTKHFIQSCILVLSLLSPSPALDKHPSDKPEWLCKGLLSLHVSRGVMVQHHTIESVGVFWLNDFLKQKNLRHSICRTPYKYKHYMWLPPSCRNPSFLELSVPTVCCIFS